VKGLPPSNFWGLLDPGEVEKIARRVG